MHNKGKSAGRAHGQGISENRFTVRIPVPFIPLTVADGRDSLDCVILNISQGGALLQAPREFGRNNLIRSSFVLPGTEGPLDCQARVVWSRNVHDIHTRVGISFEGCEAAAERVGEYVLSQTLSRPAAFQRAAPRSHAPFIAAMVNDGQGLHKGVILDISRLGFLMQTSDPIEAGSVVGVTFILPQTNRLLRCQARAAWRRGLYGEHGNVGFEFIDIDTDAVKHIDSFVDRQTVCGA